MHLTKEHSIISRSDVFFRIEFFEAIQGMLPIAIKLIFWSILKTKNCTSSSGDVNFFALE
ncbi:hypothetical protein COM64_06720 [Bacillus toyonensis]|nr:hypothetical protein COM64_06720 [Bacillus toyonensis]